MAAQDDWPSFPVRVLAVSDGDTLTVETQEGEIATVRLEGIDSPEDGYPFSRRAEQRLREIVGSGNILLAPDPSQPYDQYGRVIARVFVDGMDVAVALVEDGLAFHYIEYSDDPKLAEAERRARAGERGVWSLPDPIPPWEIRSGLHIDPSGTLHGNTRSGVVHAPGCLHYHCRNCTAAFESLPDAEAAGYRAHSSCLGTED